MLTYPSLDPIIVTLGPLSLRWYGLMYLIGFFAAWGLAHRRLEYAPAKLDAQRLDDLLFYGVLGVILGGRLGYMLFYQTAALLHNPVSLLRIWEGGMSFHGGLLGVLIAVWLFGRQQGLRFFTLTDFVAPLVPIGLGAGRLGNFINGELWGRPTDLPWGMQLPCARFAQYCNNLPLTSNWSLPLHPSQLYEAVLEGLVLFLALWFFSAQPRPRMAVSGLFLLLYGVFRGLVEGVRQPDPQLGYLAFNWLTMGQLLSLPMIAAGALLLMLAYRARNA